MQNDLIKIKIRKRFNKYAGHDRFYNEPYSIAYIHAADSTYSSGFMSMEDADIMYLEVLSLLEQAGENVYNTFVTEL